MDCRYTILVAVAALLLPAPLATAARSKICRCSLLQVAGSWAGKGLDQGKTRWTWALQLKQEDCKLSGRFRWDTNQGDEAVELVRGTLTCKRRFRLRGHKLEHSKGPVITGNYLGRFNKSLNKISGRWTNGIPGKFSGNKKQRR